MFLFIIAELLPPAIVYGNHTAFLLNNMDWTKERYAGSLISALKYNIDWG